MAEESGHPRKPARVACRREPARRGTHPDRHSTLGYLEGRIDIHQAQPGEKNGWLYVITDRSGLLKIGQTVDIHRKYYVLGQQVPKARRPMRLVHAVETRGAWLLERALHRRFAGRRVYDHGPTTEWFAVAPDTLSRALRKIMRENLV